jgi:hypothetical protein
MASVDAELEDEISRYKLSPIDDVNSALQQSKGFKIIVLDACRTNPLAAKFARSIASPTQECKDMPVWNRFEAR